MSLVAIYVKIGEFWYEDPVLVHPEFPIPHFVCWDDDDPVEIVIKNEPGVDMTRHAEEVLRMLGFAGFSLRRVHSDVGRFYPQLDGKKVVWSSSFFLHNEKAVLDPNHIVEARKVYHQQPQRQGVYYKYEDPNPNT